MRCFYLTVLLLLCSIMAMGQQHLPPGGNPCLDSRSPLQSLALNASGTTASQIVALISAQKIYICAITVQGGGTSPTFSLVQGTGTNCGTGQSTVTTAVSLLTTQVSDFVAPVGVTAAGNALCTLLGGTSPTAKGVLSFVQQ